MKKITFLILASTLLFTFTGCEENDNLSLSETYSEMELEILRLTNEYRASLGKDVLEMEETIWKYSKEHTLYMIDQGTISHENFSDRISSLTSKIGGGAAAENVAYGYTTAEKVVQGWIDSDGHRENMEGNYTHIGVAAIESSDGTYYYTQIFLNKN